MGPLQDEFGDNFALRLSASAVAQLLESAGESAGLQVENI